MTQEPLTRLRGSEPFIGTWLSIGSPIIAELAALSGFDWLLFDLEHGAGSEASLLGNLQAIRGTSALPIVRVGAPHPDLILHALDWGAAGIMVPHVESAEQAQECLHAIHYPPRGRRGFSRSARAYDYGLRNPSEVAPPLLFAQIESIRGVENSEAIAAVAGVDVLFVGPADLALDISQRTQGRNYPFEACLEQVVTAGRNAGKQAGILVRNSEDLPSLLAQGFTHVAVDSDISILR
ncbi:MAG: aldolase/citrate lyase family protein [Opitutaceae bacterium]|nr:aldolase/citrate lyase family protein [Opitutaceae bacterium]